MRTRICDSLVARSARPEMVFLTGDLGFMALEPLQAAMGARFINAGIAEQNMLTVAAALAKEGHEAWVYSIAPFCYARAFEQIRNDVCAHGLSVRIVGNGGGYAYGVMGQTHYALEDYGILCTLPKIKVFVPVFNSDVEEAVNQTGIWNGPSYLRLGRDETPKNAIQPAYAPWRQLLAGSGPVVAVVGPLSGGIWGALSELAEAVRPNLWCVAELPVEASPPPDAFVAQVRQSRRLVVVEEHVPQGGLASQLCPWLMERGVGIDRFNQLCARNTFDKGYGSQQYMRRLAGIDPESVRSCILNQS